MHHKLRMVLVSLCGLLCTPLFATPWFTGPLLAPAGKTVPLGHVNFEMYGFRTRNTGTFDRHWKLVNTPALETLQGNPLLTYGIADKVDVQLNIPYAFNQSQGQNDNHIGDVSILTGFQFLKQAPHSFIPDIRFTVQEIMPTGRFENLDPTNNGVDATGTGSYQTALGLNFQDLSQIYLEHYLRTRVSFIYQFASDVPLHGLSTHGGSVNTRGVLNPGNVTSIDVAAELTLTQNWVGVMEVYAFKRKASRFQGSLGLDAFGNLPTIGHGDVAELSLAPAIEYNFSENYGIIGGFWFVQEGKEAPDFNSIVIAFNAFW